MTQLRDEEIFSMNLNDADDETESEEPLVEDDDMDYGFEEEDSEEKEEGV